MKKDTAVAFSRIVLKERRERYVTDAARKDFIAVEDRLLVAFELGWEKWRLAFATAMGEKPWQVVIPARDVMALTKAIGRARQRFGVSESCPVFSCYEAGREGFWLHRLLTQMGVVNLVVDSSSIEVDRRGGGPR